MRRTSSNACTRILARAEPLEARTLLSATLDPSFGTDGVVDLRPPLAATNIYSLDGTTLLRQSNGDIVIAGTRLLARSLPSGKLDATFANGGTTTPSVLNGGAFAALDSHDRIVLAGNTAGRPAVERFTADGHVDTSFAVDGVYLGDPAITSGALSLTITPDDAIVIAVSITDSPVQSSLRLLELKPNGSVNTSFGTGGLSDVVFGENSSLVSIETVRTVAMGSGKLVVAGLRRLVDNFGPAYTGPLGALLAGFNANGSIDTSFGASGIQSIDITKLKDPLTGFGEVEAQADRITANLKTSAPNPGTIIVVGGGGYTEDFTAQHLVRLNSDGSVDGTFNNGNFLDYYNETHFAVEPDQSLMVTTASTRIQIESRLADGTLDASYGVGGKTILRLSSDELLDSVNVAPDHSCFVLLQVTGLPDDARTYTEGPELVKVLSNGGTPDFTPPAVTFGSIQPQLLATDVTFTVTYSDNVAVQLSSVNLHVDAPVNLFANLSLIGMDATNDAPSITATYRLTAPGGRWTAADNGKYFFDFSPIKDTSGNDYAPSGIVFGDQWPHFTVNFVSPSGAADLTPPTVTLTSPPKFVPGNPNVDFIVTYADPSGVDLSSLTPKYQVSLGLQYAATAATITADPPQVNADSSIVSVTYHAALATAGQLPPEGDYFISAGEGVEDKLGNTATGSSLASFNVTNAGPELLVTQVPFRRPPTIAGGWTGWNVLNFSNYGTMTAVARLNIRLTLGDFPDAGDSGLPLRTLTGIPLVLPAGRSRRVPIRIVVPKDLSWPTYSMIYLIAHIDADRAVEKDGSTSTYDITAPIAYEPARVDLGLGAISTQLSAQPVPRPLYPGGLGAVHVTLHNNGNIAFIGSVRFHLVVSNAASYLAGDRDLLSRLGRIFLPMGATRMVTLVFRVPADLAVGVHNLFATITPDAALGDGNATDKSATAAFTVA